MEKLPKFEITPAWMEQAECKKTPDIMYPEPGNRLAEADAVAVCLGCLVTDDCLAWAMKHNEVSGVWGAHTESERRTIRRKITRNRNGRTTTN